MFAYGKAKKMSNVKKFKGTREEWLEAGIKEIFNQLRAQGFNDFQKKEKEIKASFGHMPKGLKNTTIGVCQFLSDDIDEKEFLAGEIKKGTRHIFIRPTLKADTLESALDVFQVLAHEVCHAVLPHGTGHKADFSKLIITLLGAEGKPTATVRGAHFDKWAKPVVRKLGLPPHVAIREHSKAPKTSVKIACLNNLENEEFCSAGNQRSFEQGFGLMFRISTASIKAQKESKGFEPEIVNGETGIFTCPACDYDTVIIAEGEFR